MLSTQFPSRRREPGLVRADDLGCASAGSASSARRCGGWGLLASCRARRASAAAANRAKIPSRAGLDWVGTVGTAGTGPVAQRGLARGDLRDDRGQVKRGPGARGPGGCCGDVPGDFRGVVPAGSTLEDLDHLQRWPRAIGQVDVRHRQEAVQGLAPGPVRAAEQGRLDAVVTLVERVGELGAARTDSARCANRPLFATRGGHQDSSRSRRPYAESLSATRSARTAGPRPAWSGRP